MTEVIRERSDCPRLERKDGGLRLVPGERPGTEMKVVNQEADTTLDLSHCGQSFQR